MRKRYSAVLLLIPILCLCLAVFTACAKKVTVSYTAQEGGSLLGETEQAIRVGKTGTEVEAVPDEGYRFVGWEDGTTEARRTDAPTEDITHVAHFSKIFHIVYVAGEGGTVTGPSKQDLIADEMGSIVVAVPDAGYRFTGWDDGKQEAVRSDTITEDKTVTAKFEKVYTLTYSAQEGGSVVGAAVQKLLKDEVGTQVTAVAQDGYRFTGWDDGKQEATRSDTITDDKTVTAKFEKVYTLTYSAQEGGAVIGAAVQKLLKDEAGTQVTAIAQDGYRFTGWDDGKQEAVRSDTVTEDKTVTAKFEKVYTLTYSAQEGGAVIGAAVQKLLKDETGTQVTAVAQEGYRFTGWDDGKQESFRSDTITEDKTVTAKFEKVYTLTYTVRGNGSVTGATVQKLLKGEAGTQVTAVAQEGYRFVGWDDGKQEAARSDTVTGGDETFTAKFEKVYSVVFLSDRDVAGKVQGTTKQYVLAGEKTASVQAVPALGYRFAGWSNGMTEASITVETDEDIAVVAYFTEEPLSLPLIKIDTLNGAPIVSKDEYVTCSVTVENADYRYEFTSEPGKIKGRGNSTWGMAKKPYKLKFESKVDLFGNGAAKTWVLLADYTDKSFLRNRLAYTVGADVFGLAYTTTTQPVELYLNGRYDGVYLVCEQTQAGSTRVDISEDVAEGDDQAYLVEMDSRAPSEGVLDEDYVNVTDGAADRHYAIKSPDLDDITDVATKQTIATKVKKSILNAWNTIVSGSWSEIETTIDVESFAKCYIVHELFRNVDCGNGSWYMYHDVGGKIFCGPLWDFDLSVGNISVPGSPLVGSDEYVAEQFNPWYGRLLRRSEFTALVKQLLQEKEGVIRSTIESVANEVLAQPEPFLRNFERWDTLGKYVWGNPTDIWQIDTYEGQVEFVVDYLNKSLDSMLQHVWPTLR